MVKVDINILPLITIFACIKQILLTKNYNLLILLQIDESYVKYTIFYAKNISSREEYVILFGKPSLKKLYAIPCLHLFLLIPALKWP